MEKTFEGKLGNAELGLMLSLNLLVFGLAVEFGNKNEEFLFSATLGFGPISLNVTWLKSA